MIGQHPIHHQHRAMVNCENEQYLGLVFNFLNVCVTKIGNTN